MTELYKMEKKMEKKKSMVRKKFTLVDKITKPGEMIDNLRNVLQFFPVHNFRAK